MTFTPDEKVEIVFEGMKNDINITELCDKYNISRKTYYDWKKEVKSSAINKWENTKVGRNPKDEIPSLQKAQEKIVELKEKQKSLEEAVKEISKKKAHTKLQKDYIKFRLTESGEDPELQKKNLELLKKNKFPPK